MKKSLIAIATCFMVCSLSAQDTIYIDKCAEWTDRDNAVEYAFATKKGKQLTEVEFYDFNHQLKRVEQYSIYNNLSKIRNGKLVQYYPNGETRREETYSLNKCTDGKLWDENGNLLSFKPYYKAPSYPKGEMAFLKELSATLIYPKEATREKIEGKVVVQFTVNADGRVTNPKVVRSVHPILDKAAIETINRIAKKQKWAPAEIEGEKVTVNMIVPAFFRLN